jgi:hypothetical protein
MQMESDTSSYSFSYSNSNSDTGSNFVIRQIPVFPVAELQNRLLQLEQIQKEEFFQQLEERMLNYRILRAQNELNETKKRILLLQYILAKSQLQL